MTQSSLRMSLMTAGVAVIVTATALAISRVYMIPILASRRQQFGKPNHIVCRSLKTRWMVLKHFFHFYFLLEKAIETSEIWKMYQRKTKIILNTTEIML